MNPHWVGKLALGCALGYAMHRIGTMVFDIDLRTRELRSDMRELSGITYRIEEELGILPRQQRDFGVIRSFPEVRES